MFGIEFPELIVIAVVALIVIGPEHLPKVARTIGHLWGRAQKYVNGIKADISRDMALDEFRQMQQTAQKELSDVEQSISQARQDLGRQVHDVDSTDTTPVQTMPVNDALSPVLPRHEIIEEHHAVLPASADSNPISKT